MNNNVYKLLSKKYNITESEVKEIYDLYWKYIKEIITKEDLKSLNEEEFDSKRININITGIGKLCCSKQRFEGINKKYKILKLKTTK